MDGVEEEAEGLWDGNRVLHRKRVCIGFFEEEEKEEEEEEEEKGSV